MQPGPSEWMPERLARFESDLVDELNDRLGVFRRRIASVDVGVRPAYKSKGFPPAGHL